jgi:C-terminal processing protease CtpA/Prc
MKTCALLLVSVGLLVSQGPPSGPDMTIDAKMRAEVIDGALKALNDNYVFPEIAQKMDQAIRERQKRKEYDSITSASKFAETLMENLREVSHDKHLRVRYSAEVIPPEEPNHEPSAEELERERAFAARMNFGFEKVERLQGNIGYLDLRGFMPAVFVGDTAAAAMNFLANAQALIIDLRQNGGGDPATVALISSYLFGPEPVHLNDLYFRPTNQTHQWWTMPYVPGKRLAGKDVYVLTSHRTFSAAEEFTYNLKNLKRATIVGEVTGGGAHPGGPIRINDHFMVGVPSGRAINPISKTNWEGTGVEPDIKVAAPRALKTAHLMALEKESPTLTDPDLKDAVGEVIQKLKKELADMP